MRSFFKDQRNQVNSLQKPDFPLTDTELFSIKSSIKTVYNKTLNAYNQPRSSIDAKDVRDLSRASESNNPATILNAVDRFNIPINNTTLRTNVKNYNRALDQYKTDKKDLENKLETLSKWEQKYQKYEQAEENNPGFLNYLKESHNIDITDIFQKNIHENKPLKSFKDINLSSYLEQFQNTQTLSLKEDIKTEINKLGLEEKSLDNMQKNALEDLYKDLKQTNKALAEYEKASANSDLQDSLKKDVNIIRTQAQNRIDGTSTSLPKTEMFSKPETHLQKKTTSQIST